MATMHTDALPLLGAEHGGSIERLFSRDVASELSAKCISTDSMESLHESNTGAPLPAHCTSEPLERLFSRDVASELPANTSAHPSSPPIERLFSRDVAGELPANTETQSVSAPLERLFSRDVVADLPADTSSTGHALTAFERVLLDSDAAATNADNAGENFVQQTAGTQTAPDRDGTMSPTSILENAAESEGETPLSASVFELEALVFSPSGPREGTAPIPEGPRGLDRFRTALDAHARPSPTPLDPQLLARRDRYEAALLELNAQFKARWLDFDQSVAMAEPHAWSPSSDPTPGRSPTGHQSGSFRSPARGGGNENDASFSTPVRGGVNRLGGLPTPLVVASHTFDPVLNCPTPPGALTAPASPPLSAEDLSAYLASLGITISSQKAQILVAGYEEPVANGAQPCVKMQRLRKDMRVAVARSLRPVPSPRPSVVGAGVNGDTHGVPGGASGALSASVEALPLPSLAPVNTRIPSSASVSKNKSPAGTRSASDSDESPCIWSPKIGISSRPLGATPPAIVETQEEESAQQDSAP